MSAAVSQKRAALTLENYIAIAPGIMVSSTSPAYSTDYTQVSYGGKTYAILETGNDYSFKENPQDYHFELTAYTYHPMLVDGTLYNATFENGSLVSLEEIETVISATNTLKGRLYVTKTVEIPEGAIGYDLETTTFPITITLKDKDGNPIVGEGVATEEQPNLNGVMYRIQYGKNHPFTDEGWEEWNETYQNCGRSPQKTFTNGTVTESIYAGDTIYVGNLPTGATYEVTEGTLSGGWKLDSITYGDTNKKIAGNDEDQVTVKNTLPCVDVVIQKRQQDGATALSGAIFDVYTEEAYGKDPRDAALTTVTSDTNGLLKLGVLPAGTYYLVETFAPAGYNKLSDAAVLKVEEGKLTVWQNTETTAQPRIDTTPDDTTYDSYITNDQGVELPHTGGTGTLPYTLGGIALIMASALMYGFRMRRRERRLN